LIDAAVEVFERVGYASATIDDIVEAANATRPTFYQYFSGKREMAAELQQEIWTAGIAIFDRALDLPRDELTASAVREWIDAVADFYESNRPVMRAVLAAAREDTAIAERIASSHQRFIELVAPKLVDTRPTPARIRALMLEAQRSAVMEWVLVDDWPFDREAALDELGRIWADALGVS
jgi:AcrR family transcriptional regulator